MITTSLPHTRRTQSRNWLVTSNIPNVNSVDKSKEIPKYTFKSTWKMYACYEQT
jgi:hypothetical protein